MRKVVIVGGCGHVGLPLGLALAESGIRCIAYDIDESAVATVNAGTMPFKEAGAEEVLKRQLATRRFSAQSTPECIQDADVVVIIVGTPVDEHANPDPNAVLSAIHECLPHLNKSQLVMLRSTVYPGVTRQVEKVLSDTCPGIDVAFCPERIVEGHALQELRELPQIIGARTDSSADKALSLFESLGVSGYLVSPEEAELAKLFTNAWRYVKFASANQFWMMANDAGLDFSRIHSAITFEYARAEDLPGPGFAAGPCLFKDTAQLAAFSNNLFPLGNAAMQVNEGLPLYLVNRLAGVYPLDEMVVGILGMAFKAGSDDTRSSLSYKLKRILKFRARGVLTTDPHVQTDPEIVTLDYLLENSDIGIIAAPHSEYRTIASSTPLIDIWNLRNQGSSV